MQEPAADFQVQLLVIGAGPGGYTAAFRAADLGLSVTLVDRWPQLGGVCLNVGCIPSKALLHAARVIEEAESMAAHGIRFQAPEIDAAALQQWKNRIVGKLTAGLTILAKQRKVSVIRGTVRFVSAHRAEIVGEGGGRQVIGFEQCIIAAGSEPARIPGLPDDPRVVDSTGALDLAGIPRSFLVIGGGIIGLEMACVYDALGSKVSVVELTDGLMPGCDRDLVRPLEKRLRARYAAILTGTKVTGVAAGSDGLAVTFEGKDVPGPQIYERVLCAVGRVPNGRAIRAAAAGVTVDDRGHIPVDRQMRTNVPHIFAIGDIVGQPMLAHKATHEGKVAAEVAAGQKSAFDARVIPSVAYTDPEIAWVGVTEAEAQVAGRKLGKGHVSVDGERALARAESRGRLHEASVRPGHAPRRRRRHRRHERGRPHLGGRARDRDGRDGGRRRPHRAPAPDALRDGRLRGRSFRRHAHRPLHPEEEVAAGPAAVLYGHLQMSRTGQCGHLGLRATQT